jgi:hypothetical protein
VRESRVGRARAGSPAAAGAGAVSLAAGAAVCDAASGAGSLGVAAAGTAIEAAGPSVAAAGGAAGAVGGSVAADRPQRKRLVHRRRGGLCLDAGSVQPVEQLLAAEPLLLGYLMNALFCHQSSDSRVSESIVTGRRNARGSARLRNATSRQSPRPQI